MRNDRAFHMQLDDGKVFKRFGRHPERGKLVPGCFFRRERDRKMFERGSDAYDLVQATMVLTRSGQGWWRVTVDPVFKPQVKIWLKRYCG